MRTEEEVKSWLDEEQLRYNESFEKWSQMLRDGEDKEESFEFFNHKYNINYLPIVIGTLKWVLGEEVTQEETDELIKKVRKDMAAAQRERRAREAREKVK